jgi:hypothetical protein
LIFWISLGAFLDSAKELRESGTLALGVLMVIAVERPFAGLLYWTHVMLSEVEIHGQFDQAEDMRRGIEESSKGEERRMLERVRY